MSGVTWAFIKLFDYSIKIKVAAYEILSPGNQVKITDTNGAEYITSVNNVVLSTKEPIYKTWSTTSR